MPNVLARFGLFWQYPPRSVANNENSSYLHPYYDDGVGIMLDHLQNGTPLPDDQVIRAKKKGTGDITADMFTKIERVVEERDY